MRMSRGSGINSVLKLPVHRVGDVEEDADVEEDGDVEEDAVVEEDTDADVAGDVGKAEIVAATHVYSSDRDRKAAF